MRKRLLMLAVWMIASPDNASAARHQAVLLGGNYVGGKPFDDNLSLSAQALANNMDLWGNWDKAGPNKNIDLLGGATGRAGFTAAMDPYQAGGANALEAGDVFMLFYFGHGGFNGDIPAQAEPARFDEVAPALTANDEYLAFADRTKLWDDELATEFAQFDPGVYKLFVDISCFSGGFWGGNDLGDLDTVPRTALMRSSPETLVTLAGGLGPRPWEPLYLRNLINFAHPAAWPGANFVSFLQWHNRSVTPGSGLLANRFDEFEDLWDDEYIDNSMPSDQQLLANFDLNEINIGVPEPATLALLLLGLASVPAWRGAGGR